MLTLITSKNFASDNGNKFLCLDCSRALVRSGTGKNEDIICRALSEDQPVKFVVTNCSHYVSKTLDRDLDDACGRKLLKQAWTLESENGKLTFRPPEDDNMPRPRRRSRRRSRVTANPAKHKRSK